MHVIGTASSMSQTRGDLERRSNTVDGDQTRSSRPSQGESSFGDSSGPFFSIYSKAAEEEDNKMVERWQKDADGILIFTGLFSAAVAALLGVTVLDLRPDSQDTSAFYLGNIYEFIADPNVTRASNPSPVAKPPPFSPPRYAVWVNIFWFLSLVMSLSCALLATSLHQWARRYIRLTQPARCSPEKRARMRAYFANGVETMHIPWAVEGLPTLLHLSLFFFFSGLVVFLFNVNREVFIWVVWWIGLFSMVYGFITVLPLIRQDSPYYAPLSTLAWFLYANIQYVTFRVLAFITGSYGGYGTWKRCDDLRDRYRSWVLGGMERTAKETASEHPSKIDVHIFGWTIGALGTDDSLEKFFEAIPGLFNSKLVKHLERDFPETLLRTFWRALDGFMGRTLSSNSVTESVKSRRVIICKDIMSMIPCPGHYVNDDLHDHFDQATLSIERLQAMARWFTHISRHISYSARARVAKNLVKMPVQERDGRWVALTSDVYGLSEGDLQRNVALGGDDMLLATLLDVSRRTIHPYEFWLVGGLTQLDMLHTLPRLQHQFCTLWNEFVQEARDREYGIIHIDILRLIRHLYITLHQDTDAGPTAFSASTDDFDSVLFRPSSYPLCDIASHREDWATQTSFSTFLTAPSMPLGRSSNPSSHHSPSGGSAASERAEEINIIAGPHSRFDQSHQTTSSVIGETSQALTATFPVHSGHPSSYMSPQGGVATAQPDTTSAQSTTTLSHPLESNMQEDIVTPCAVTVDTGEVLSTVSASVPVPASTPPVLNKSIATYDAAPVFILNSSLSASSVYLSNPDCPLPPQVPLLPDAELLSLIGGTSPKGPSDDAMLPCSRGRRFVDDRKASLANAMLQLLVCCPPFWDLFRDLGWPVGQREGGETGGGATPLIDATVRFLDEFAYNKKSSLTQQIPQKATRGKAWEDKKEKEGIDGVDSFIPTYVYNAMKEKRQFINNCQVEDESVFLGLYLEALDEELVALHTSMGTHKPAFTLEVEELDETQSGEGHTEAGERDIMASSVKSPISRIFDGMSRLTVRTPNHPDTVTVKDWRLLQPNIQPDSVHNVEDALAYISRPEPVQVDQLSSSDVRQQVQIEEFPPVLVLHLKQFVYDAAADRTVKIRKPVQFGAELEIPLVGPEIMAPVTGKSAEPVHYKLYGVLYHHDESAGSGRYTVDVLHPNKDSGGGEAWLHIDNEAVSVVRHEDVFGKHDNDRVDDRCANMLFYCRTGPART